MKVSIICLLAMLFCLSSAYTQNAREIAVKSSDAINLESLEMVSTLKIYDSKGNVRVRKVTTATKKFGETNKTKIKFLSPADVAGTSMLIYDYESKDDDMWVYLPAMRNTRRIVSSEKGKNFMGSEFTNADMSKPNLNDFNYKLLGNTSIEGKDCWQVESVCKDGNIEDANGFSKKVASIEKVNFLPRKMEYYDLNGDLFKVMVLGDYRKLSNGSQFAYRMEMKNLKNGRHSEMTVEQLKVGSKLTETDFSTVTLSK